MVFFLGAQERVRNSSGKLAIGVRAIEVLLLVYYSIHTLKINMNLPWPKTPFWPEIFRSEQDLH